MRTLLVSAAALLALAPSVAAAAEPASPARFEAVTLDRELAAKLAPSAGPRLVIRLERRESDFLPLHGTERLTLGAAYRINKRLSIEAEITRSPDGVEELIENGFSTGEKGRGSTYSFNPFQAERMLRFKYTF